MSRLEALVRANRDVVVAVGETGLDLFRTGERGAEVQRRAFRDHIALAKELGIPVYDINLTGYPQRMRDWNARQRREQDRRRRGEERPGQA